MLRFALLLLLLLPLRASGAWPSSGSQVNANSGSQSPEITVGSTVCSDDEGGMIAAFRYGASAIRIQRSDGEFGSKMWDPDGVVVTTTAAGPPHVERDGLGGAWVVWNDNRASAPGLYVQRFNASGVEQFTSGGLRFSDGAVGSFGDDDVDIGLTPSGKLLVAFWDGGVRLQRLQRSTGADDWGVTGVQLSVDPQVRALDLSPDGEGACVVWESQRLGLPGFDHIFASRVNASGQEQWGDEGVLVQSQSGVNPVRPRCEWDGSSLFVTWAHLVAARTGLVDVNAQKLNSSGVAQWNTTAGGVSVLFAPFDGDTTSPQTIFFTRPAIASDGAGGCYIVWVDGRDYHLVGTGGFKHGWELYGQRLNGSGVAQWTANGKSIDSALGEQYEHVLVPDGSGNVLIVYTTYENQDKDIAAAKLNSSGTRLWKHNISNFAADDQEEPRAASDGFGGFVTAWSDERNASTAPDIYGNHRNSSGTAYTASVTLTAPNGGERLIVGIGSPISWTSNFGGNVRLEYLREGVGKTVILASTPNDGAHTWGPVFAAAQSKVYVGATDGAPADSSNAFFTICGPPFGSGSFTSSYAAARDVLSADFDGDGSLDIAVAVTGGLNVARGNGDGTFATPVAHAMASYGRGIAARDFDRDGVLDLAVTNATGVGIFLGDGEATFGAVTAIATGTEAQGVAAGDYNEDGFDDLAVANATSNDVSILLGQGDGSFAPPVDYAVGTSPQRLVSADFNEDGMLDLAVSCAGNDRVSVLLGQGVAGVGNGSFATAVSYVAGTDPSSIAVGDFNEDGRIDLVVGNFNTQINVLLGNGVAGVGNGTFASATAFNGEGNNRDLVVGDFTGDGIADIVAAASSYNQMSLYRGNGSGTTGNGTFTFVSTFAMGAVPEALVAGDFDGSGTADIVGANRGSNSIVRFSGNLQYCNTLSEAITLTSPNGGGTFDYGDPMVLSWTRGARVMAVDVEISRDGGTTWDTLFEEVTETQLQWHVTPPATAAARIRVVDSLVASRQDQSDVPFEISDGTAVTVTAPNGGESFVAPGVVEIQWTDNLPGEVKLEYSVDGDARQTIVASTPSDGSFEWALPFVDSSDVRVYVSDAADGSPQDASNLSFSVCNGLDVPTPFAGTPGSPSVRAADLDEDGAMDLVAAVTTGVEVRLGPSFVSRVTTATGGSLHRDVAIGDFDADGIPDVAVSYSQGVGILLGVGGGDLGAVTPYAAGTSPRGIASADVNGDGFADIVVANSGSADLSLLLGNGDGTFAAAVSLAVQQTPLRVRIHDVNVDGAPDLLVTNNTFSSNSVSVLLGQLGPDGPTGSFAAAVNYPAGSNPGGLSIGDFNEDGAPDLAVGANVGQGLVILLGQVGPGGPTGSFGSPTSHPFGFIGTETQVADLDGDGKLDVIVASSTGDRMVFFMGRGDGSFASAGFVAAGDSPDNFVVSDLDADGHLDLAIPVAGPNGLLLMYGSGCGGTKSLSIDVAGPGAGEVWEVGEEHNIEWTTSDAVGTVDVELSRNDGVDWELLAAGVDAGPATGKAQMGSFVWFVSGPATSSARLRVRDSVHAQVFAESAQFEILDPTVVDVPELELPRQFGLRVVGANPFHGRAQLELALPRATDTTIAVFDARGRRVRVLAPGRLEVGRPILAWDGRDDGGRSVGSGVFFVRAELGGTLHVQRLVRVE